MSSDQNVKLTRVYFFRQAQRRLCAAGNPVNISSSGSARLGRSLGSWCIPSKASSQWAYFWSRGRGATGITALPQALHALRRRSAPRSFPHSRWRPAALCLLPGYPRPALPSPSMALPAQMGALPSSKRAAPVHFALCPPSALRTPASVASARPVQRWRKRLRAFEFQGSRQIRAQRRREPRQPRGPSMDSLPGEDPTLPLAFEGRYGGAAGRGCAQAARLRVAGPGPPAADGDSGTAPGFCPLSALLLLLPQCQRPPAAGHLPRGPSARPARRTR